MTYLCPRCCAQNPQQSKTCCRCGARLDEASCDYIERLICLLRSHPDPSVPPVVAETLGRIGDRRAVEPLIEVVSSSEDPVLLKAAIEALGRLCDTRAIPVLVRLMRQGTAAARTEAVSALEAIAGKATLDALEESAASNPDREYQSAQPDHSTSGKAVLGVGEPHKRGISVTLTLLDETLCKVEQWANGSQIKSVFYREHNSLSRVQRDTILAEIAEIRALLSELQETLRLEPAVEDVTSAIRSNCMALWEHVVELKGKYLRRYGEVPAEIEQYLDPRTDRLIQGIVNILDALKQQGTSKDDTETD